MERKYKILQVDPNNKDAIRFFNYDFVKDQGFCEGWYKEVYSSSITENDAVEDESVEDYVVLEDLFRIFNTDHPIDFKGHSLSCSDIVILDNCSVYFCDDFGWKKLNNFNWNVA